MEQERAELDRLWQQRRERAAYEVERAARQYQTVEPEHRLVARTLERAWEEKLLAKPQLDEEYHRFTQHKPRLLSQAEREAIRRLATDIPALWTAPTTTASDQKEIIRQVVERVIVDVQDNSERVKVRIEWIGAGTTSGIVIRPVGKLSAPPHLSTNLPTSPRVDRGGLGRHRYCSGIERCWLLLCSRYCLLWGTDNQGDTTNVRSEGFTPAYQVSRWTFAQ